MTTIGKRIKQLREQKGKTASEIAQAIHVPISTYREWEYGRSIKGEFYIPLSQTLGISLLELLTGKKLDHSHVVSQVDEIERLVVRLKNDLGSLF